EILKGPNFPGTKCPQTLPLFLLPAACDSSQEMTHPYKNRPKPQECLACSTIELFNLFSTPHSYFCRCDTPCHNPSAKISSKNRNQKFTAPLRYPPLQKSNMKIKPFSLIRPGSCRHTSFFAPNLKSKFKIQKYKFGNSLVTA